MRAAVEVYGGALEFASERLRDTAEIVRAAVSRDGLALKYASDRLRDDETFMRDAIEVDFHNIRYASERLRDDEAFIRKLIKEEDHRALKYASERLRHDDEFVFAAVRDDYNSVEYASSRLKTEPLFVRAFVKLVLENDGGPRSYKIHSGQGELSYLEEYLLDLLKKNAEALAEARSQLNREVIDVDSGETTYEPAPKRARTERAEPPPRSGLSLAAEAATSTREIKIERDAERRRADDLEERNECCVCMEADAAVCFLPCRHLSTCEACAADLQLCAICQTPIQRRITVFRN